MKAILIMCSEGIVLDRNTNNISVFNILEDIGSVGFPLLMQKFYFFSSVMKEGNDKKEEYELNLEVSVNDTIILTSKININFNRKLKTRAIVQFGGLAIPKAGTMCFKLLYGKRILGEYSIFVRATDKPNIKILSNESKNQQKKEECLTSQST